MKRKQNFLYLNYNTPDEYFVAHTAVVFFKNLSLKYPFSYQLISNLFRHESLIDFFSTYIRSDQAEEITFLIKKTVIIEYNKCPTTRHKNNLPSLDKKTLKTYKLEYNEVDFIIQDEEVRKKIINEINNFLSKDIKDPEILETSIFYKNFKEIERIFKLSDIEMKFLKYLFLMNFDKSNIIYFNKENQNSHPMNLESINKKIVSAIFDINICDLLNTINYNSKLFKYYIISENLHIDYFILKFINGYINTPLQNKFYKKFNGKCLSYESFIFEKNSLDILNKLLSYENKNNCFKILFYGRPGTGKTEFAKTILKKHNYNTYILFNDNDYDIDNKKNIDLIRIRGIYAYKNIIDDNKNALIIDEADELLSVSSNFSLFNFFNKNEFKKGKINTLLDETNFNQIWIVNNIETIDETTLRRFDFILEFSDFSYNQRKNMWIQILNKYKVTEYFSEENIEYFVKKYEINAGIIEKAIQNFKKIIENEESHDIQNFIKYIETIIDNHIKAIYGYVNDNIKDIQPYNNIYDLRGLNIVGNLEKNINILENFSKKLSSNNNIIRNMNVLLWGPPGTGKTEFAKYIARKLERKIIIKTPSDILNKYVGETEKNIAKAFEEAEKENAILFIDEIDGILQNREKATNNWEITQVNELLIRMEKFNGIFICATNFFDNIDPASARRFSIKIEFKYLEKENIKYLFNTYFGDKYTLSEENANKLAETQLISPGDFKIVYQKLLMFDDVNLTENDIIDYLMDEVKIKKKNFIYKKLGF